MVEQNLMRGFPPLPEMQVTLANWREPPYNRWAFRHVRQLVPSAPVPRGEGPARPLPSAPRDLGPVAFADKEGREQTVAAMLDRTYTDGFIVLRDGHVVAEAYDNGLTPDRPHILMSVTKSVAASLTGVLADRGVIDPEAPIVELLPEVAGSAYGDATIRHLLDMTVGIRFVEDYQDESGDMARYRMAGGWRPSGGTEAPAGLRGFLPSLVKEGAHGEVFHYVSPNSDLLGWVIERAAGVPFAELLGREIWAPMGAEHEAYITVDPLGAPRTAGGLCVSLRDLARFGALHLDTGGGSPAVMPGWWLRDMRENGDPEAWRKGDFALEFPRARYRSKWYLLGNAHGAYCGLGVFGQMLYVDPVARMVIAKFSSQPKALDAELDDLTLRAFAAIGELLAG
jgi:CubicO group peptidase (beta-lactamase class C family)